MLVNCTALFQGWIELDKTVFSFGRRSKIRGLQLILRSLQYLYTLMPGWINASTNNHIIFHQPNIHLLLFCYSFSVTTWNLLLLVLLLLFTCVGNFFVLHTRHQSHTFRAHSCSTKRTSYKFSMQWDTNILIQTDGKLANVDSCKLLHRRN